jgi:hypothetical protein
MTQMLPPAMEQALESACKAGAANERLLAGEYVRNKLKGQNLSTQRFVQMVLAELALERHMQR